MLRIPITQEITAVSGVTCQQPVQGPNIGTEYSSSTLIYKDIRSSSSET